MRDQRGINGEIIFVGRKTKDSDSRRKYMAKRYSGLPCGGMAFILACGGAYILSVTIMLLLRVFGVCGG